MHKLNHAVPKLQAEMEGHELKSESGDRDPNYQALRKELEELAGKIQLLVKERETKLKDRNSSKQSRSSDDQALLTSVQGGSDRSPYYDTISDVKASGETVGVSGAKKSQGDREIIQVTKEDTVPGMCDVSKIITDERSKRKRLRWISVLTGIFIVVLIIASIFDS